MYRGDLPQLSDGIFLTDSGIETDLSFHFGWELPEFACFVLLDDPRGYADLQRYFRAHVAVAERFNAGVILETPTWRASSDWGDRLGYSKERLCAANHRAVEMLAAIRGEQNPSSQPPIVISGCIGPRADGYSPDAVMDADEAHSYHQEQIDTFRATEADMVHAMTITYPAEAIGVAAAAKDVGLPAAISFTTETDGRLPDGTTLAAAIATVDHATGSYPAYYGINCAHPTHFCAAFPAGDKGGRRIRCLRANASIKSHAEIDESAVLDEGNLAELAGHYHELCAQHPQLTVLGGCCGTDVRHVEAIASVCLE